MSPPRHIVVLGGSGFIGSSIVDALVDRANGASGRIVVPTRHPARAKHLQQNPTVELPRADVFDDPTLARLVTGADAVINLIAILHGSPAQFQRVHVDLPARLAQACATAGVERLIHISAIGVGAAAPSHYLRSKAAGEEALRRFMPGTTILRPSLVFGEHDKLLNLFATLQRIAPFVPLAGADARVQPVWVEDVARAVVRCLDDAASAGRTYEIVGPQVCTLRQLVRKAGEWSGHPRLVFGIPDAVAQVQALVFSLLPGEPLISSDNIASLRAPNVATGSLPGLGALGIEATPMEAIVPSYLGRSDEARLDFWRSRARRS